MGVGVEGKFQQFRDIYHVYYYTHVSRAHRSFVNQTDLDISCGSSPLSQFLEPASTQNVAT